MMMAGRDRARYWTRPKPYDKVDMKKDPALKPVKKMYRAIMAPKEAS
jgi:hypothetical protein